MTDAEFFTLTQLQWFSEFVQTELSENSQNINAHREIFEFDDVPF